MKTLIALAFITIIGMGACSKNKEYCWECYLESDPTYVPAQETFCGLTEKEARDINRTGYLSYSVYLVPRKCVKK